MKKMLMVLAALTLAACGSAPKQVLTSEQYESFARDWQIARYCGEAGMISPALAARGHNLLTQALSAYDHNPLWIESRRNQLAWENTPVDRAGCNAIAMQIEGASQRTATSQAPAAAAYRPQFTTCNRAFNQVFCTTY
jgi:hypothetical protein